MSDSSAPARSLRVEFDGDLRKLDASIDTADAKLKGFGARAANDLSKVETKARGATQAVEGLANATANEAKAEDQASQARERGTSASQRRAAAAARQEAALQREIKLMAEAARIERDHASARMFFASVSERAAAAQAAASAANGKAAAAANGAAAANDNLGKKTEIAGHHLNNLLAQLTDVGVSLQAGQSPFTVMLQQGAQILPTLGETGVMGAVRGVGQFIGRFLTPATVTVGLLSAAVIYGYTAWSRYDDETRKTRATLEGLGRGLGLTVAQFEDLASAAAKAGNLSTRQAADIGRGLASIADIGPDNLTRLIELSKAFGATFGLSLDEVREKLKSSFGSVDGITRLNRELNFLDAKTMAYVESLYRQGRAEEAVRVAIEKLPQALARQEDAQGIVARAWKAIATAVSEADLAVGKFFDRFVKGPAPEDRLKQLQDAVTRARDALRNAESEAASATFNQRNRSALDTIKRPGLDNLPPMEVVQDFRFQPDPNIKQKTQDVKEAEAALKSYGETLSKQKQVEEETARNKALEESLNRKSNELRGIMREVASGSDEWLRYRDLQQSVDAALKSGDPALMSRVDNVKDLTQASNVLRHVTESMTKTDGERMTQGDRAAEQRRLEVAGIKARTTEERASLATAQAVARSRGQLVTAEQALADAQHAGQMVREQDARQLQDMLRDRQAEGAEIREQIRLVGADAETRAVAIARRRTEQEIVRDGKDLHSDAAQAVIREAEANARLGVVLDNTVEAQRRMQDAQRQLGGELGRFFDDILIRGQKLGDVFKSLGQTIASGALRGLLTGEGPFGALMGTAGEGGGLGGLLGGKLPGTGSRFVGAPGEINFTDDEEVQEAA